MPRSAVQTNSFFTKPHKHKPFVKIGRVTLFLAGLLFISLDATSNAESTQADIGPSLEQQRYQYELAKSQLKRRDFDAFERSRASLKAYPLAPYLDYQKLTLDLNSTDRSELERFIKQHRGSYLGERMLRRYLQHLAVTKQWSDLVYWYEPAVASKETKCLWREARHRLGDQAALEGTEAIWVSAKSLPKRCDALFQLWFDSEHYRPEFAWKRFIKSASHSQRGLARYLASVLPEKEYQNYVELVWELDARPYRIKTMSKFRRHTPEMQQIISFGIKKYAQKHPVKALQLWEQYEASMIFDEALTQETKLSLVKYLLRHKQTKHVKSLLRSSPSIRQTHVIERLIRAQLKDKNWSEVLSAIELLDPEAKNSDRWQYWQTRAKLELGIYDKYQADYAFSELAKKRSFYGFLAADIISAPYSLQDQSASFPNSVLAAIAKRPAFQRAKELWLTNYTREAHAEWYYGLDKLSSRELAAAGVLAHQWGWYDKGIQAMIAGRHWHHLDVRFPLAFKEHILNAADETELAPSFIFAVARQESAMSEQAVSSAGARGVMQLMPTTAKQTARKNGIKHNKSDLYRANHNIQLGSQYLDELLNKFNGNRILAAAAYNAGPHRVNRWTNKTSELDYDLWIETIPFKETRGYVQNVLTYAVIYSVRMGLPAELITKLEANQKL